MLNSEDTLARVCICVRECGTAGAEQNGLNRSPTLNTALTLAVTCWPDLGFWVGYLDISLLMLKSVECDGHECDIFSKHEMISFKKFKARRNFSYYPTPGKVTERLA